MTREEAVALARMVAEEQGWTWLEPVKVRRLREGWFSRRREYWSVLSNADCRGCNVWVEIDIETGQLRRKGFMPR